MRNANIAQKKKKPKKERRRFLNSHLVNEMRSSVQIPTHSELEFSKMDNDRSVIEEHVDEFSDNETDRSIIKKKKMKK